MRHNTNKGEITLIKAIKRESQLRNNANKGKKKKPRESQMQNNANKSEITPNVFSYITLYVCTSNHDNQFHMVNCFNNF